MVINDTILTKSRGTYIRNFVSCLGETGRMTDVKFVNLTMDGELSQAVMIAIDRKKLPVTFVQTYPNTR